MSRLVVKIGSSLLVSEHGLRRAWLGSLAADLANRRAAGDEVIIVTSGAIAMGRAALGPSNGPGTRLEDKQATAAIGQIHLAHAYQAEPCRSWAGDRAGTSYPWGYRESQALFECPGHDRGTASPRCHSCGQ